MKPRYCNLLFVLLFALAGCTDPKIDRPGQSYRCSNNRECGADWACVAGICVPAQQSDVPDVTTADTDLSDRDQDLATEWNPDLPDTTEIDVAETDMPGPDTPDPIGPPESSDLPDVPEPSDLPDVPDPEPDVPDEIEIDNPDIDIRDTDVPDQPSDIPDLLPGQACGLDDQCTTGICKDGVCCLEPCTGTCQTCASPDDPGTCLNYAVGLDPEGECPPCQTCDGQDSCAMVPAGQDPMGDCTEQSITTCGQNGWCDGVGGCQRYPDGSACGAPTCANGEVSQATCRSGQCLPERQDCGGYICADGASCLQACQDSDQCMSGYDCDQSICFGRLTTGKPCVTWTQCASHYCVDGVCCETACDAPCQSCQEEGASGHCVLIPEGEDPDGECAGDPLCQGACDGQGACGYPRHNHCGTCQQCDGVGNCQPVSAGSDPFEDCEYQSPTSCGTDGNCDSTADCRRWPDGSECQAQSCDEAVHTVHVCQQGQCQGQPSPCEGGYACLDASVCRSECFADDQCGQGWHCHVGVCEPDSALGAACENAAECASRFCVGGICCDSLCDGPCESCLLVGLPGQCTVVPDQTACADGTGSCSGTNCVPLPYPLPGGYDWSPIGAGPFCEAGSICNPGEFRFLWPPDSGQTTCYDGAVAAECRPAPDMPCGPGEPDCGQDGEYGWDVSDSDWADGRFVPDPINPDIIIDTWTQLVWAPPNTSMLYTWPNAPAGCANLGSYQGHVWQVPDDYQLMSLVDYGHSNPASRIPAMMSQPFWTSATYMSDESGSFSDAWSVNMADGSLAARAKVDMLAVRCVVSLAAATDRPGRFYQAEVSGDAELDALIFDAWTGLLWPLRLDPGLDWSAALQHCEDATYAGFEWRLPNIFELRSLIDTSRYALAIDLQTFTDTMDDLSLYFWWTSTSADYDPFKAWSAVILDGGVAAIEKSAQVAVRCVALGPPSECSADADCGGSQYCSSAGRCSRLARDGQSCERDAMCQSANCRVSPSLQQYCVPATAACAAPDGSGLDADQSVCSAGDSYTCDASGEFTSNPPCVAPNDCQTSACDEASGQCQAAAKPDGTVCDGLLGTCESGSCLHFAHSLPSGYAWTAIHSGPIAEVPLDCRDDPGTPCNDGDFRFPWPPDSGQRYCYDASQLQACQGEPGSDECATTAQCGQDAQYGWDNDVEPSHHDWAAGRYQWDFIGDQSIVADQWTKLTWQQTFEPDLTWRAAVSYCAGLAPYDGIHPWRLPSIYELESLLDFGRTNPSTLLPVPLPTTLWSATTMLRNDSPSVLALYLQVDPGITDAAGKNDSTTHAAICVASPESSVVFSTIRYFMAEPVAGQSVIFDTRTGLMWPRSFPNVTSNWVLALSACEQSTYAGRGDWRLPNELELLTIVDHTRTDPHIDSAVFPSALGAKYWSSTSSYSQPDSARVVYLLFGTSETVRKDLTISAIPLCVTAGP